MRPDFGQQDLSRLLGLKLPGLDARPKRAPYELVVVVHGTFANPNFPAYPGSDNWWSVSGSFAKALDSALERHGSRARCSEPLETALHRLKSDLRVVWRGWSGGNSEVERRKGADELATYLRSLQNDPEVFGFHIVAHSHGGNVVRRAFQYMNDPTAKLGRVVCLGTPFLHFKDRAAWRRWLNRVHWPMLAVLAALVALAWWSAEWLGQSENFIELYWMAGLIGATLLTLWRFGRNSQASSVDVPITALRFSNDEAIQLLRTCANFVAEPHLLLRELLGGTAPKRERAERPRRQWGETGWFDGLSRAVTTLVRGAWNAFAWCSDVWNRPICRFAERATSGAFRLPLVGVVAGNVGTLVLISSFRPYRPALRPLFTTRLPRLRTLFHHSMDEQLSTDFRKADQPADRTSAFSGLQNTLFDPQSLLAVAAFFPVVIYWVVIYPIDKILGLLPWLGAVGTRFFILLGARAAAAGAPGMDMFGAAFAARKTGETPSRVEVVAVPEAIETDLESTLDARTRVDLASFRRALDPARSAMLLDAVKTAFSDPGLLHAQYYQDERIVDYIARLIAHPRETPPWPQAAGATSGGSAAPS